MYLAQDLMQLQNYYLSFPQNVVLKKFDQSKEERDLELEKIKVGILQLFVKHTSAALTINENTDQTVRQDFETHFNILVPENEDYYKHIFEGCLLYTSDAADE